MSKTIFGRFRSEDGTVTRCDMTIDAPGSAAATAEADDRSSNSHLIDRLGRDGQSRERSPWPMIDVDDDEAAPRLARL